MPFHFTSLPLCDFGVFVILHILLMERLEMRRCARLRGLDISLRRSQVFVGALPSSIEKHVPI